MQGRSLAILFRSTRSMLQKIKSVNTRLTQDRGHRELDVHGLANVRNT